MADDPRRDETGWQSRTTATGARSARAERRRTGRIVRDAAEVWVPCGYCGGQRRFLEQFLLVSEDSERRVWVWEPCKRCEGFGTVPG